MTACQGREWRRPASGCIGGGSRGEDDDRWPLVQCQVRASVPVSTLEDCRVDSRAVVCGSGSCPRRPYNMADMGGGWRPEWKHGRDEALLSLYPFFLFLFQRLPPRRLPVLHLSGVHDFPAISLALREIMRNSLKSALILFYKRDRKIAFLM